MACISFNVVKNNYSGMFPENLKKAKVIPIYKRSDASILLNYCPISVLFCFSEILEGA